MSIKRFLAQSETEVAYRNALAMLLEGVAAHALELDRAACRGFRQAIGEIRGGMNPEAGAVILLAKAGSAVQAIEDYARQTASLVQAQGAEMRNMIAMLAGTVVDIGGVGGRAVERLQKIGDDLERAAAVEDVATLKKRLQACLGEIREEAKQQKAESTQMVQALRREVSRKQAGRIVGLDLVTDLPGEAVAQAQFASALRSGDRKHVGVFVLGSARLINLRFGRATGDDAVRALKQYLAEQLAPGDHMFRWPGPAVVALMAGTDPFERVSIRLKRLLEKPIERTFDVDGHSVSIPLPVAWSVLALSPPLENLNRQIHDFVASQGAQDEEPIPA
ncbi:MAG: GGDEF domain-containing protein [Bryobacteraceae bacterium]